MQIKMPFKLAIPTRRSDPRGAPRGSDSGASPARPTRPALRGVEPRGQVIVIFAFLLTILLGMAAFVVDLAWIWSNQLQVQRAADAGALAGVVHLPADAGGGIDAAKAESQKNGFTDQPDGQPGPQVVAGPDPDFSRRMIVTVSAPVDTFFLGLFGFHEVTVSRTARAEYILPVPMGSPQNYLGVGRLVKSVPSGTQASNWETADRTGSPSNWTNDSYTTVRSDDGSRTSHGGGSQAAWRDYDFGMPSDAEPLGIEVEIQARKSGSGNCRIGVELSSRADNNTGWTSTGFTVPADPDFLTTSDTDYTVGGPTELWGDSWTLSELESSRFGIRLERADVSGSCTVQVDRIRIRVHYQDYSIQEVDVDSPYGTALVPQNFWAGMQSQGAPSVQGDAFMTKYTSRTSYLNSNYCPWLQSCASNPEGFYNYAIELPAGGEVWIFDPGFCDGGGSRGTGEYWTIGGSNGASSTRSVSAFYRLYNTNGTAWDYTDDTRVDGQSGTAVGDGDTQPNTFRRGLNDNDAKYYDASLRGEPSGSGYTNCEGTLGHHSWWKIGSNLPAGTYRLNTNSHDRILTSDQDHATALNAFAIWASTNGGASVTDVRVYGLGAMEAYFPLPAGTISQFYLAQIEAIHAGKWVDISLWDPGDTGDLSAYLSILMPQTPGNSSCANPSYCPVPFYYNYVSGTTIPTNFTCGPSTSSQVTSIQTSAGSGGWYNGQWVRLCFQLPEDWTAPIPTPDALTPTGGQGGGWFRIQYDMGSGGDPSTDLTTWKVEVRGNPVHLITPGDDTPTP